MDHARTAGGADDRDVGAALGKRVGSEQPNEPVRKQQCIDETRGMGWHTHAGWNKTMHSIHGNSASAKRSGRKNGGGKAKSPEAPRPQRVAIVAGLTKVCKDAIKTVTKAKLTGSEGDWAERAESATTGLLVEPETRGESDAIGFVDQMDEVIDNLGRTEASLQLATIIFEAMEFSGEGHLFTAPEAWSIATPTRTLNFTPFSRATDRSKRTGANEDEISDLKIMVDKLSAMVESNKRELAAVKTGDDSKESKELMEKRQLLQRRLKVEARSTRERLEACVNGLQDDDLWPWEGTTRSARLARDKCLKYYSAGLRCSDYYDTYLTKRQLKGTQAAEVVMFGAAVLDAMLIHDQTNVMNLASAEIIVRKMHGYEEALRDVWSAADVKKAKRSMIEEYDLVGWTGGVAPEVQKEVSDERKVAAQYKKWAASGE